MANKNNIQPDGELRQSQLLTTFGPGAMVDLPEQSVTIGGLSYWKGYKQPIQEQRLQQKVQVILGENVQLYAPPVDDSDPTGAAISGIDAFVFPRWFLVQIERNIIIHGKRYRTRPLVHWSGIKNGCKWEGKKCHAVPVRFVQACVNGHLSDINWQAFAHQDFQTNCLGQIWLDEAGSGNDFEEIFVRCDACRKRYPLSLAKLPNSKILGKCLGDRPWLNPIKDNREECQGYKRDPETEELIPTNEPEQSRLLVRSASNAYFSQCLSVISLPDSDHELRKVVDKFYEQYLKNIKSVEMLETILNLMDGLAELKTLGIQKVWEELARRKSEEPEVEKTIKDAELEVLLACGPEPQDLDDSRPVDEVDFEAYVRSQPIKSNWQPWLDKIVLVHRLREVIAQVGFTRFEAVMPDINGELDINVRRASLDWETNEISWVPAIANKGEGIFFSFNREIIENWAERSAVIDRSKALQIGYKKWLEIHNIPKKEEQFPGMPYILLHSLSHLLITTISLECGYSSTAIKERIYANSDLGYGILIYTGSSGAEGTLGGLIEIGDRLEDYLDLALERGKLCSNDPICSQHIPGDRDDDSLLQGAACHGCLLIAESSCERSNDFLDRALVVNTLAEENAAFFA
jgi:hypothetical protein